MKSDTVPAKRALTKGKRPQRESLPDRPPFTLESLRQLLAEEVIRRQQTMPDDAEISELARILNYWQGHYLIEQKSRALRELQRAALAALATLANVFPRLRDLTESFEANAVGVETAMANADVTFACAAPSLQPRQARGPF